MPLTKLDTTAALIVIDLQKGIIALATVHPTAEIIGCAAQLARFPRARSARRTCQRNGCGSRPHRHPKAKLFASSRLDRDCFGVGATPRRSHREQAASGRVHRHIIG